MKLTPREPTPDIHNPWRESLENCISGDNYLRASEYRDLIEELDELYRLRAMHDAAPEVKQEPYGWHRPSTAPEWYAPLFVVGPNPPPPLTREEAIAQGWISVHAHPAPPAEMPNLPDQCPTYETISGDHTICQRCGESWPSGNKRACERAAAIVQAALKGTP